MHPSKHKQEDHFHSLFVIANVLLYSFLALHFYIFGYGFFHYFGLHNTFIEAKLAPISKTLLFDNIYINKIAIIAINILALSMVKVYKKVDINLNSAIVMALVGAVVFFAANLALSLDMDMVPLFIGYGILTLVGFILLNSGLGKIFKHFKSNLKDDIFNKEQETFPQEKRKITSEYSVNLPAQYIHNKKTHNSWINFISLFRGLIVVGSPGSGKTYFVIRHIIKQLLEKNFTMLVYDFKYPGLTKLSYNILREAYPNLTVKPTFYTINFDELQYSHRVNPLMPDQIHDISDAYQSARSIYLGMSSKSEGKEDLFWEDGAINTLTGIIWFLKKEANGKYCTMPHVLEIIMSDHKKYIPLLMCDNQSSKYISVLYNALVEGNEKLMNNMMATLKQKLAKLASPSVYWVMSGNDFSLDINNPDEPKVVCLANNDQKSHVYSAPISLIVDKLSREINKPGKLPCATIFDEFSTIYFENVTKQIATGRENKIATVLGFQDGAQNEKNLGRVNSDIIFNITANIISGSLTGKISKDLSERLGKIKMVRDSINLGNEGPTASQSVQMDYAVPTSTINNLTSGEVVGVVADSPEQPINQKIFHAKIINDHNGLKAFDDRMADLPIVYPNLTNEIILENYNAINKTSQDLVKHLYNEYLNKKEFSSIFEALN